MYMYMYVYKKAQHSVHVGYANVMSKIKHIRKAFWMSYNVHTEFVANM